MPLNPGGRHPLFAHGTHTMNCLRRLSSTPPSATALSVGTLLLQAAQVATSALFSLAFSDGIDAQSLPWIMKMETGRAHSRPAACAAETRSASRYFGG